MSYIVFSVISLSSAAALWSMFSELPEIALADVDERLHGLLADRQPLALLHPLRVVPDVLLVQQLEPEDDAPALYRLDYLARVVSAEDEPGRGRVPLHRPPQRVLRLGREGVGLVQEDYLDHVAYKRHRPGKLLDPPPDDVYSPGVGGVELEERLVDRIAVELVGESYRGGGLAHSSRPREDHVREALAPGERLQPLGYDALAYYVIYPLGPVFLSPCDVRYPCHQKHSVGTISWLKMYLLVPFRPGHGGPRGQVSQERHLKVSDRQPNHDMQRQVRMLIHGQVSHPSDCGQGHFSEQGAFTLGGVAPLLLQIALRPSSALALR